jgi:hypothetical protein
MKQNHCLARIDAIKIDKIIDTRLLEELLQIVSTPAEHQAQRGVVIKDYASTHVPLEICKSIAAYSKEERSGICI